MTTFENVSSPRRMAPALGRDEAYEEALGSLKLCGMLTRRQPARRDARAARPQTAGTGPGARRKTDAASPGRDRRRLDRWRSRELVDTIKELRRRKIGIVWIEHIVHILLQVAERLVCMDAAGSSPTATRKR